MVQVAPDQTARFRGHPIEPSQAAALHPAWGIGPQPGIHVEGLTHREQHPVFEQRFDPGNPALLLRGAQTHPNEVGFETPQLFQDPVLVGPKNSTRIAAAMEGAYYA